MQNITVNGWTVDILTDEKVCPVRCCWETVYGVQQMLQPHGLLLPVPGHLVPAQAPTWAVGCLQRLL